MRDIGMLVLGAIVSAVVGYVVWLLQRERRSLRYRYWRSQPLALLGKTYVSHGLEIHNRGNRAVKDVSLVVALGSCSLAEEPTTTDELVSELKHEAGKLTGKVLLLNPDEWTGIGFTTTDGRIDNLSVRAEDATAIRDTERSGSGKSKWMNALSGIAVVTFLGVVVNSCDEKSRSPTFSGDPDSTIIVWDAFRRSGLGEQWAAFSGPRPDVHVIDAALWLAELADRDASKADKVANSLEFMSRDANVRDSSSATCFYLLSRLAAQRGDIQGSRDYLAKCEAKAPATFRLLTAK